MRLKTSRLKQWLKALVIASLWFFCPTVLGAVFDVAPQDKSKEYLGIIFGGQIGSINLGGASNPMLGRMFERFNFIIVTIGTVVVSYIGILSVINTAREGEALGKKFTTWMILRAVFGLLFMIPTPGTGYSLIQVMVAWLVLNGIGAANSVWEVVINQLGSGVQATGSVDVDDPPGSLNTKLTPLSEAVLRSSSCMQGLNAIPSYIATNGRVKINVEILPSTPNLQNARVSIGTDRAKNICGIFNVVANPGNPEKINIKVDALKAMFEAVSPAAQLLTSSSCAAPDCPAPGYLLAARNAYTSQASRMLGVAGSMAQTVGAYEAGQASKQTAAGFIGEALNQTGAGLTTAGQAISSTGETAANVVGAAVTGGANVVGAAGEGGGNIVGAAGEGGGNIVGTAGQGNVSANNAVNAAGTNVNSAVNAAGTNVNSAINQLNTNVYNASNAPTTSIGSIPGVNIQSGLIDNTGGISADQRILDMKNIGWIHAGGYYYILSKSSSNPGLAAQVADIAAVPAGVSSFIPLPATMLNNAPSAPATGWSPALLSTLSTTPVAQATLLNNTLASASAYIIKEATSRPPNLPIFGNEASSSGNDFIDAVFVNPLNSLQTTIITAFMKALTGNGVPGADPLISIGKFGTGLMVTAELLPIATMLVAFGLGLVVGVMSCISPLAGAGLALLNQLVVIMAGIAVTLWGLGATLGVYIPMVPYVIFLTTAFGWMMAVIEAIVGAPILALGMVHPSQDELGKVAPGLAILANIFLRPTLMIFGFILAASLLRAGLAMLNYSFMSVLSGAVPTPSMFKIVAILALYLGLVLAIVNQSFSLIYDLPNKILRWMGGPSAEGVDTKHMGTEAKGEFDKGAGKAQEGVKAMQAKAGEKSTKHVGEKHEAGKAKHDKREADKKTDGNIGT